MNATAPLDIEKARFNMIEQQVRPWKVGDTALLSLMTQVPREQFAPALHASLAFSDMEIPLKANGLACQCMLAPKVQARLLQDAAAQPHHHVLHIGTGSGYTAAILGKQAQQVVSIEIDAELAAQAQAKLQQLNIHNVKVVCADATAEQFKACKTLPAYDVIVISGSVAQVPPELLSLLKPQGRLVAIVGTQPMMRACLTTRNIDNTYTTTQPWDYVLAPLQGFAATSTFQF
jgi:protein-L-isoaspartate(D-aspartate) O-methyltransferase